MTTYTMLDTPIGPLAVAGSGRMLNAIRLEGRPHPSWVRDDDALAHIAAQLHAYFAGELTEFDLDLEPQFGGDFERSVWREVADIPYGETASYLEIATRIGKPAAVRAVGRANGRNPIPIVVPCHRVIGSNGSLTGYAGGLETKRRLLDLEAGITPLMVA
jgi:methylated-DNA-[protein]-cysteine S-methyltransferase